MPRLGVTLVLVLALLAAGCGSGASEEPAVTSAFREASPDGSVVELVGDEARTVVTVEVADTSVERARGLMGRASLAPDAGMVFLYPSEAAHGGFWMKDTLIPLSIAFFDAGGRIVRILDMEPCPSKPCPRYDPEEAYVGALEVNQGAYERWGIAEGDLIRLRL